MMSVVGTIIQGGPLFFSHAGDDCTDIFAAFHPTSALKDLQRFEIGDLDETIVPSALYANKRVPAEQKEFEKAYRELRAKILAMGLFNPSYSFYAYKVLSNVAIAAAAIYLAVSTANLSWST